MAAAAEQPEGPWPFARMAASSLVYVSTYIFLALPCPADKGPTARPFGWVSIDPVDLIENAAVGKEFLLHLAPVTERVADAEGVDLRKLRRVFLHGLRRARTVIVLRRDLLVLFGVEELQVSRGDRLRVVRGGVLVHHRDRWFGKDAPRRNHD